MGLAESGYEIVACTADIAALLRAVDGAIPAGKRAGTRTLLDIPEVAQFARGPLAKTVTPHLGEGAFPVRAILFDKTEGSNWSLGWHQDRAIAVCERIDVERFTGWSQKEGAVHVLPPAEVLEGMLTARFHLDDCGLDNAPLRVSPGTHTVGLIDKRLIPQTVAQHGEVVCTCSAGDVLLMRPLLLHASSAASRPGHRRVVHVEYANRPLPGGLEWRHCSEENNVADDEPLRCVGRDAQAQL